MHAGDGRTVRAWRIALISVAVIGVAGCTIPPPPAPPRASGPARAAGEPRNPVVFIHGFQLLCGSESPAVWKNWTDEALRRGYRPDEIGFFAYDTCLPNQYAIDGFGVFVRNILRTTGAKKVDIVAHSMGSLVARACIRFGTCAGLVDKFDSVAGANHGTIWAGVCGLAFWSQSTCDMNANSPFLARLNADDETWGDTQYVTMVSWCDLTIVPFTSVALAGALNIVTPRCLTHTDWRSDIVAARWTFDWFDQSMSHAADQPLL